MKSEMQERLKRFYRSEAPPIPEPPPPSWWERNREGVKTICIFATAISVLIAFIVFMNTIEEQQKLKRIKTFKSITEGCQLVERNHGNNAEVIYKCGERLERFPTSWESEAKETRP